jgi:hypothetical protein
MSAGRNARKGMTVSKDKKKKSKDDPPKDKKGKKRKTGSAAAKGAAKAAKGIKALTDNPLVADIVAAALVGMASALKDSDKARRLAGKAGDELGKMSKTTAKQGSAMWDLALDVGRQTLETLAAEGRAGKRGKSR